MTALFAALTDRAYSWMMKIIVLSILMAFWYLFVEPYAQDLLTVMQWYLNMTLYRVLPEQAASFVSSMFVLYSTFTVFKWIVVEGTEDNDEEYLRKIARK